MYTSITGKKLVARWNERNGTALSLKEFFDEKFYPVFYDHEKYLQWITNSPFVQGYRSAQPPDKSKRMEMLAEFHRKIVEQEPDASIAVGFSAEGNEATTSGQLTGIKLPFGEDDMYSSWIGSGLGVGVDGGLLLLFDEDEILELLYEGWSRYRSLVEETPNLKGNQINTWNGQWLTFALGNNNYKSMPFAPVELKKDTASLPTVNWIKLLFRLARRYPNKKLMTYVYSLGQTNTTVGFIQINLPELKREIDMYVHLFGEIGSTHRKAIEEVYVTQFGFKTVCRNGSVGLKEIEPKQLREYLPGHGKAAAFPKLKDDEKSIINYNIYLSWVLCMLNNKSLIDVAGDLARMLRDYETGGARSKTGRANKVLALLDASSRRQFIEKLTDILADDAANGEFFNALVLETDKMQADKFPYFLTLIKFKYTFIKSKN
ncbi:MAG: hypothetical protein HYV28_09450 [Ignavibacteriales bacterium]|nr:hypothetical protein [Ignavibacteriales bacterium]